MADDPLAESVGEVMKEEESGLDPRLEKLALGTISESERAELKEAARSDPELARAVELHEPLSSELRQQIVREAARPRGKVILLGAAATIGAIAAAASIALFWSGAGDPIPQYGLRARAGDAKLRGDAQPRAPELRADSTIELVLQPSVPAEVELEASLFILSGGAIERSPLAAEISKDGAVRWIGRADAIAPGRTGPVTLIAVVGRRGELPEEGARSGDRTDAWQSEALEVLIRPAGGAP